MKSKKYCKIKLPQSFEENKIIIYILFSNILLQQDFPPNIPSVIQTLKYL